MHLIDHKARWSFTVILQLLIDEMDDFLIRFIESIFLTSRRVKNNGFIIIFRCNFYFGFVNFYDLNNISDFTTESKTYPFQDIGLNMAAVLSHLGDSCYTDICHFSKVFFLNVPINEKLKKRLETNSCIANPLVLL